MQNVNTASKRCACATLGLIALCSFPAFAQTRIAVLEFELHDLTLLPRTPEELERTASVAPLLRAALVKKGGYESVTIAPDTQAKANAAFGYLFDHPEVAAELGARFGAEWVAIGRLHKPSFLFAFLMVHLVNVNSQRLTGDLVVRVEGRLKNVTERGVVRLAEQIVQTINAKAELFQKLARTQAAAINDFPRPGSRVAMTVFRTGGRTW
ncbi:MAG: DUF2380 domain-containing protein [Gammaproteobacteria bacterium]